MNRGCAWRSDWTGIHVRSHRDRLRRSGNSPAGLRRSSQPAAGLRRPTTRVGHLEVDADGKTHVDTPQRIVGTSAAAGALWGLLFGVLFFVPGMALLGGALGAVIGKLNKSGVDDRFRAQVHDLLSPGHSAVVIMAGKITEDKFAAGMQPFGGKILKTSLSETDEKELAEELAGT